MKMLINVRAALVIAVAFILGIFAFYESLFGDVYFGLAVALFLVALCLFFVFRGRFWKFTLVTLIFAILGFGLTWLSYAQISSNEMNEQAVTLSGRVADLGRNGDSYTFYLEDCVDASGKSISGRVRFGYSDENTEIRTGDLLTISGTISSTYPIKSEVETYYIRNSIRYELSDVELVSIETGELKLDEKIRKYIYDVTQDYMGENGSIVYALLTGDRNAMSESSEWAFSRAGIVHLLAVSGLHVGFIVTVFCFALRRLRLHPLVEGAIVVVPLLFYAYICGFSPSVMRAVVMVVCSYIARAVLGRYDMLTSISLAALVILFVKPFYLFDVGFQLSFLSVFGIATVYISVDIQLQKRKINRVLRSVINAFLLSLSCTVATLCTVALHYGEVPVFGVIVNLVAIPLMSVVFVLGFIGLIPSVFHYVLVVDDFLLKILVRLAEAVAQLSFATVSVYVVGLSTLITVVLLFVVGGYVNLSKLGKRIFYPVFCLLLVLSFVFAVIPKKASNQAYVFVTDDGATVAAISDSREAVIVGDFADYAAIYKAVDYLRKFRLDSCNLYISQYSSIRNEAVELAVGSLPVDTVYVLDAQDNDSVTDYLQARGIDVVYQFPNSTTGSSVRVRSIYDAELRAVTVNVGNMNICAAYGSESQVTNLLDFNLNADIYILPTAVRAYSDAKLPFITYYQSNMIYNYGANKYGNFTIKQKDDRILLNFR